MHNGAVMLTGNTKQGKLLVFQIFQKRNSFHKSPGGTPRPSLLLPPQQAKSTSLMVGKLRLGNRKSKTKFNNTSE